MDPLGVFIDWVAKYGMAGLICLGVLERFVPILPSYALLVAIGIAAANGDWTITSAFTGAVVGSLIGCLLLYWLALALGEQRSYRLVTRTGRLAGMAPKRVDSLIESLQNQQRNLAFGAQLVPVVRLMAPLIAGLFRVDARSFLTGTAAGVVVWNGLFLSVGYAAARWSGAANPSTLALQVLIVLVAMETVCALAWRRFQRAART